MPELNDAGIVEMDEEEYHELCEDNAGVCIYCGNVESSGIEPDAEKYKCSECEEMGVYGVEQLLMSGKLVFVDAEDDEGFEDDDDDDDDDDFDDDEDV